MIMQAFRSIGLEAGVMWARGFLAFVF